MANTMITYEIWGTYSTFSHTHAGVYRISLSKPLMEDNHIPENV